MIMRNGSLMFKINAVLALPLDYLYLKIIKYLSVYGSHNTVKLSV